MKLALFVYCWEEGHWKSYNLCETLYESKFHIFHCNNVREIV